MTNSVPIVVQTEKGRTVSYKDRFLYSQFNPTALSEKIVAQTQKDPDTIYLIPSPLLGYGLITLLHNLPERSCIVALENDPLLYELAKKELPEELQSHPLFYFLSSGNVQDTANAITDLHNFRRCIRLNLSSLLEEHANYYTMVDVLIVRKIAEYWLNHATLHKMSSLWFKNIFKNLSYLQGVQVKTIGKTEKCVFVAGAGESLEKSLGFIKKMRSSLYVLAVDTAFSILSKAGIVPDAIICLESQVHNLHDFVGKIDSKTVLFCDLSAHSVSMRLFGENTIPIFSLFTESETLQRIQKHFPLLKTIPPLGSVGIAGAYIAGLLTDKNIFISGLDFSYRKGKTHAKSAPSLIRIQETQNRLSRNMQYEATIRSICTEALNSKGEVIISDPVLKGYAKVFSSYFSNDARFIDLRDGGIDLGLHQLNFLEAEQVLLQTKVSDVSESQSLELDFSKAEAFLKEELFELSTLYKVLKAEIIMSSDELQKLIKKHDYLYKHFPDTTKTPNMEQNFLNRVLAQVVYWQEYIKKFL